MKITQFSVGCSRTINLGNFESLRVEAQVVAELGDDEKLDERARAEAQIQLRQLLEDTYKAQHKPKQEK